MLILLRILFTGAFIYDLVKADESAGGPLRAGDLTPAFYLATTVILAILTAMVWAPLVGEHMAGPFGRLFTEGKGVAEDDFVSRLIRRLHARGHRKTALFFCFIQGLNRPWLPGPFIIGLKNSRPGSWLEKVFAREVLRFDNVQHCMLACEALERQGIHPPLDQHPELKVLMAGKERGASPDAPPVPVPKAPAPPSPKRNPRIRLFETGSRQGPEKG